MFEGGLAVLEGRGQVCQKSSVGRAVVVVVGFVMASRCVSITLCQVRGQRVGYTVVIQPSYRTIMRCIHAIHGMLRVVTAGRANKRSSPSTGILLLVRILEYIFVTGDTSGSAQSIYGKTENDH